MPDVFLFPGQASPKDVRLIDPTRATIALAATTTFAVLAVTATIIAPVNFAATAGLQLGTVADVTVGGPLLSDATISLETSATLSIDAPLAAASAIAFGTGGGPLTMEADLRAAPGWTLAMSPPRLYVGGMSLTAAASSALATTAATLTSVPAVFNSQPGIRIGTQGNLSKTGPSATSVVVTFNGVEQTHVRVGSIQITDVLNEAPNTCDFLVDGTPPAIGTDVKIGLQNVLAASLLFGGTVVRVEERYEELCVNQLWAVSCRDYTFLINRRKVWGTWTDVSATTVATAIVTTYAPGFSTAFIAAGLPAITVTFDGVDVMAALTQIASRIGGYCDVGYVKDVHLFVGSEAGTAPNPLGSDPLTLSPPPITYIRDESQVRTRDIVIGKGATIVGSDGFSVAAASSEIPVDDAGPFSAGQVITDDKQIANYTGTAPGGVASTVTGNVPGPGFAPTPALVPGVAGHLSGSYRWAAAFANASGETPLGPFSFALLAPDIATPANPPGLGASGAVGPMIGPYSYKSSYLTTLGETLPGPAVGRTASALLAGATNLFLGPSGISRLRPGFYQYRTTLVTPYGETVGGALIGVSLTDPAPPAGCSITSGTTPGELPIGAVFNYRTTFVTEDGETAPGAITSYSPAALSAPFFYALTPGPFGGLFGGPYSYGVSLVTALGEGVPLSISSAGSGFFTAAPGAPFWSGGQDTAGRIAPGTTYFWACSAYSDVFGETPLGPAYSIAVTGTAAIRMLMNLPALPAGADGLRVYRGIAGGAFMLNAEFRRATGVPSQYWDALSTGENGSQFPIQTLRAGVNIAVGVASSAEPGVIARRVYRTKANGSEYFFVGELQHNAYATIVDGLFDTQLAARNPIVAATGRQAVLTGIPTGPTGTIARRVYRTKAGGSAYYLVGELKDNNTTTLTDNAPDTALTIAMPTTNTAGAVWANSRPNVSVPTGPTGTIARRVYRTKANGSTFYLLTELPDNSATTYGDNVPDDALGATTIPAVSSAGGEQHVLTSIPIGPTGTLARRLYRTTSGGSEYKLVQQFSNNSVTTWLDTIPDESLGAGVALMNTAGSSAVNLSSIPVGPLGVTQRIIYRTAAGGTQFKYVGTIDDNLTTTFLDDKADSALGRTPFASSTIGALAGDTSILLKSTAGIPPAGWFRADSQVIRYTGISGNALIGIPPLLAATIVRSGTVAIVTTAGAHGFAQGQKVAVLGADQSEYTGARKVTYLGPTQFSYPVNGLPASPATGQIFVSAQGAITGAIAGGLTIATVPMLTGVSGLGVPLPNGGHVALFVICNSAAGQAALAASEGGDGVHEHVITDSTLDSVAACTARGNADLALFQFVGITVTYDTLDTKTKSGTIIHIALGPPQNLTLDLMIQRVVITNIDIADRLTPRYSVMASNVKFSLDDALRHMVLDI